MRSYWNGVGRTDEEKQKLLPPRNEVFKRRKRNLQACIFGSSTLAISLWAALICTNLVRVDKEYSVSDDVLDVVIVDSVRSVTVCAVLFLCGKKSSHRLGEVLGHTFDFTTFILIIVLTKLWVFRRWSKPAEAVTMGGCLLHAALQMLWVNQISNMECPRDWKLHGKSMRLIMMPYFVPTGWVNKLYVILTWVMVAASKVSSVITPLVFGSAIAKLSATPVEDPTLEIAFYCLLLFAPKLFTAGQSILYTKVWQTAYLEVADATFRHVHSLSLEWHLKKKIGSVQRVMDRGMESADNLITYLALYIFPTMASSIATFVVFVFHFEQPLIASAAFLSLFLYCWVTYVVTMWRRKYGEKMNKNDNDMHEKATDALINFETVKYFTNEDFEAARYLKSVREFQNFSFQTQVSLQYLNLTQSGVQQLCMLACLSIGAFAIMHQQDNFQVSDFVSVQMYIVNIFAPLSYLGSIYSWTITSLINMQNLSELLAEEPDIIDAKGSKALDALRTTLEFRNVRFTYATQQDEQGIHDLSFSVPSGTTTALVGETGCGKTTVLRLLFRFYNVSSGEVLINGQNISNVTQKSLRGLIGVVPQDTVMFNETIRYNIAYGRTDATHDEIENAARQAQLLPFIENLEKKWDTVVGERGLKLSGGEKQRIAIARCLLKNAPIVVLDEATSALDNRTEREVQQALDTFKGRTMLVVAHRLSTIRYAQQILVLSKGRVVERGTHEDLLARGSTGVYFSMWNAQSRKFVDEVNRESEEISLSKEPKVQTF